MASTPSQTKKSPTTKTAKKPRSAGTASGRRREASDAKAPVSSPRKQLVENEVLEHATRLFAERGFEGTSLQDIASAMGLKRPALYYYFKSKDELLDRLILENVTGPAHDLKTIAEQADLSPAERLHAMIRQNVRWVLTHTDRFLLMLKSQSSLSPESARKFNAGSRESIDTVTAVIEEGIEAGQFRSVNARVAALGVFGTSNWSAWWYQTGGADSVDSIADQLADLAVASVQRVEQAADTVLTPPSAIALLRQDLDRLEKAIERDSSPRREQSKR